MSSDRSGEELQHFKSVSPTIDEDGDIYYDPVNLEDALESLSIKNDSQNLKLESKDKEHKYELNVSLGDREIATKIKEYSNDKDVKPTEIRKSIINSLGYLIKIIGETLSTEDMDEIIEEDVNCDGNVGLHKLLKMFEKEDSLDDDINKNDTNSNINTPNTANVRELRKRMICIGTITKSLGKNLTEEDLQDILNEDLDLQEQPICIDFAKLLEIMEKKLWGFQLSEGKLELGKKDNVTVRHIQTVLTSLGTVMIGLGQTISDEEFGQIMKRDSSDGNCDFSKLICNMIEKEIKESDCSVDIIRDFGVFDSRGTGYTYVDELRDAMMSAGDTFCQREMAECLEDIEVNEYGQFSYVDYVTKVSMKRNQEK
ncbi:calmodulin-like protein 12 [Centruroides sculpturatus]|uniref:calmodulin-like protein 12 n=1 Tax=Centruroides sculpturatus TaxID=218467 RepID=UPI000C6E0474|nr:calmodulin-like protein 12 [Centruroides sculpturatus]